MSPLLLRHYRAERLLRQEFDKLRSQVLGAVRGRLRSRGVQLDDTDLEACYAIAWQGLYAAVLEGQEVANPAGWLVLVSFRRAIDEHRSRLHEDRGGLAGDTIAGAEVAEVDMAREVDDRDRLRHLFEGLKGRLSVRECQAASLCYLQGLSRSEAAAQMGISDARLRKLMEGEGREAPGVAGKFGELLDTIRAERWCEQQSSLMRALAFGILDPDGERYRLAQMHRRECPACRAYVRSLRGLAAVLPPVVLPQGLGGAAAGVAGGMSAGALSASGAAGVGGAAGSGWLLAGGPVGAKLAVGCLLALGFGAGCVALTQEHNHDSRGAHRRGPGVARHLGHTALAPGDGSPATLEPGASGGVGSASGRSPAATASALSAQRARREFGPERTPASVHSTASPPPTAKRASVSKSSLRTSSALRTGSSRAAQAAGREFGAG